MFFFFQAEDGIRDLVRSRGLGDVYKRQVLVPTPLRRLTGGQSKLTVVGSDIGSLLRAVDAAVSYTHLTLPTSDLV